jgi:hypothetical protein
MSDAPSAEHSKGIAEQNSKVELQLKNIAKDIKLIGQSRNHVKYDELSESIVRIQSQLEALQSDVTRVEKSITDLLAIVKSRKEKGKKKKDKKKK